MKAILVIDVDDGITKYYADIFKEGGKNDEMVGRFYRFKPMPQPKGYIDAIEWYLTEKDGSMFTDGWNACLEALEDLHNGEDSNE